MLVLILSLKLIFYYYYSLGPNLSKIYWNLKFFVSLAFYVSNTCQTEDFYKNLKIKIIRSWGKSNYIKQSKIQLFDGDFLFLAIVYWKEIFDQKDPPQAELRKKVRNHWAN